MKFASLYDYDLAEFEYQKTATDGVGSNYWTDREYRLYLNHHWVRMLDEEQHFYYSTLSSLSYCLSDELDELREDIINTLIPHKLVEGPEHDDKANGGVLWDLQTYAKGREAELDELKSRSWAYSAEVYDRLSEEFHHSSDHEVYFIKHGDEIDGPRWDVVVRNAETARQISFTSFLADCQKLLQPIESLDNLLEREKEKQRRFLHDAYDDIVANFDPKIVKLKKKRKVIMSSGALESLSRLTGEDE